MGGEKKKEKLVFLGPPKQDLFTEFSLLPALNNFFLPALLNYKRKIR